MYYFYQGIITSKAYIYQHSFYNLDGICIKYQSKIKMKIVCTWLIQVEFKGTMILSYKILPEF
jgi:hypothetical protein